MVSHVPLHPRTGREAAAAKAAGAVPYAGGTDLMVRRAAARRTGQEPPLVFLDRVATFRGITAVDGVLRIGSLTTMAELCSHPATPGLLTAACTTVGSPALRNAATIGGNICTASPAGDSLPALYALDAEVELCGIDTNRRLPIDRLIIAPGQTALKPDELLAAIIVPAAASDRFYYRKVSPRLANALAKVSLAVTAMMRDQVLLEMRIAFGAVGPTVIRCTEIERQCRNRSLTDVAESARRLADLAAATIRPIDDLRSSAAYRRTVAGNLLETCLHSLCAPTT
jgi:xanthine dehydrogenase FAD-binding subunit